MSISLAIIGRGEWLLNAAKHLSLFNSINLVVAYKGDSHYKSNIEDFRNFAVETQTSFVHDVFNISEINLLLQEKKIDAVISSNLPLIVPKVSLELVKFGWLNGHPAPLPKYRGNACPNWAILNDEKEYGIVVHLMDEGLDEGPVLSRFDFKMDDETYISQIYDIMNSRYPELFEEALRKVLKGDPGEPQNSHYAHTCFPRIESDSQIDWNQDADSVLRTIRSFSHPFPGAFSYIDHQKFRIFRAKSLLIPYKVSAEPGQIAKLDGKIVVFCKEGAIEILDMDPQLNLKRRHRFSWNH
jgi:methionyl-tRNA formyltransferase